MEFLIKIWTYHWHEILFFIFGGLGMIAHYIKKQTIDGIDVHIKDWFSKDLPKTITAVIAFISATTSALSTDVVTADSGLWTVIYVAITTGFASDGFNGVEKG